MNHSQHPGLTTCKVDITMETDYQGSVDNKGEQAMLLSTQKSNGDTFLHCFHVVSLVSHVIFRVYKWFRWWGCVS